VEPLVPKQHSTPSFQPTFSLYAPIASSLQSLFRSQPSAHTQYFERHTGTRQHMQNMFTQQAEANTFSSPSLDSTSPLFAPQCSVMTPPLSPVSLLEQRARELSPAPLSPASSDALATVSYAQQQPQQRHRQYQQQPQYTSAPATTTTRTTITSPGGTLCHVLALF
jgi:hypothetical protein